MLKIAFFYLFCHQEVILLLPVLSHSFRYLYFHLFAALSFSIWSKNINNNVVPLAAMNEYRIFLTGDEASTWRRLVGRYYWLPDSQIISHLVQVHELSCKDHCSLDRYAVQCLLLLLSVVIFVLFSRCSCVCLLFASFTSLRLGTITGL